MLVCTQLQTCAQRTLPLLCQAHNIRHVATVDSASVSLDC